MKILVLSDSHGRDDYLAAIVYDNLDCDTIVHLGDGEHDFDLISDLPEMKQKTIYQVRGNCDFSSDLPITRFENIGGYAFYLTHGYVQHVKYGVEYLMLDAQKNHRNVALFGHTHKPYENYYDGVYLFNPGAVCNGRYGKIEIKDGSILFSHGTLRKMDTF
ncbi:MAG: metallophosphoesterase family protein [Acutalibacteraceae bacterium]